MNIAAFARRLPLVSAFCVLAFGVATSYSVSLKWMLLVIAIYSIPALSQAARPAWIRAYGLWFGVFLVVQTLISPVVRNNSSIRLKPSLHRMIDVRGGLPGIDGIQGITTDRMGFRVTKPINYENKGDTTYRIFVLGGSTTEQVYLDDKRTWTHLLQQELADTFDRSNIEVINTGVSGTRIVHHLATLKEISRYHPDMAVFLLGFNDWSHDIRSHFNPFIEITFDTTLLGKLIRRTGYKLADSVRHTPDNSGIQIENGFDYQAKRGSLAKKDRRIYRPYKVARYYSKCLVDIVEFCTNNHISCVFLTQPNGYHKNASEAYKSGFWMTPFECTYTLDFASMVHIAQLYNGYLVGLSKEMNVDLCDLASEIPGSYEYMYDECHFNQKGAGKMASLTSAFLQPIVSADLRNK